jgi:hypothetical protein
MAGLAFFALLAFVDILVLVTAIAGSRRAAVFFLWLMTGLAVQYLVLTTQSEVRVFMIEGALVECGDRGVFATMLPVTLFAGVASLEIDPAMETLLVLDVATNVFMVMAVETQTVLARLV